MYASAVVRRKVDANYCGCMLVTYGALKDFLAAGIRSGSTNLPCSASNVTPSSSCLRCVDLIEAIDIERQRKHEKLYSVLKERAHVLGPDAPQSYTWHWSCASRCHQIIGPRRNVQMQPYITRIFKPDNSPWSGHIWTDTPRSVTVCLSSDPVASSVFTG